MPLPRFYTVQNYDVPADPAKKFRCERGRSEVNMPNECYLV